MRSEMTPPQGERTELEMLQAALTQPRAKAEPVNS